MIELDGLAAAREHAGREPSATVMAEVGRRLRATVRGEDVVARLGGGAFAVLAHGADADVDRLASRCLSVVEQPIMTPAGLVELTAGIGLVPLEPGLESRRCWSGPTSPSAPRTRPAPARPAATTPRSATPPPAGTGSAATCRAPAPGASSTCCSSRSSRWSSSGSPASRPSCAGGTPSSATSRRPSSCRWPSAPA